MSPRKKTPEQRMPDAVTSRLVKRVRHVVNSTYCYLVMVDASGHQWDAGVLYFPTRAHYDYCERQLPAEDIA